MSHKHVKRYRPTYRLLVKSMDYKKDNCYISSQSDLLNIHHLLLGDNYGREDRSKIEGKLTTFGSERQSKAREKSISKPLSAKLTRALSPKMRPE